MVGLRRSARLLGAGSSAPAVTALTHDLVGNSTPSATTTKSLAYKPQAVSSLVNVITPESAAASSKPKASRKRSASSRLSDSVDLPPPFVPQPVLDIEQHRAQVAANLAHMSAANSKPENDSDKPAPTITILTSAILKGIDHLLQIDPSIPALLGPEWKADLFAPLSNACAAASSAQTNIDTEQQSYETTITRDYALLDEYFQYMARGVLAQQISGAAARTIVRRFKLLFYNLPTPPSANVSSYTTRAIPTSVPDYEALWESLNSQWANNTRAEEGSDETQESTTKATVGDYFDDGKLAFPHPYQVIHTAPEILRSAGLSTRKVEYVIGLSHAFLEAYDEVESRASKLRSSQGNNSEIDRIDLLQSKNNGLDNDSLENQKSIEPRLSVQLFKDGSDLEIEQALVALKGVGPWSAEMFLLYGLGRLDVFSRGDLGIQRGLARYLVLRPEAVRLASEMQEELEKLNGKKPKKRKVSGSGTNKKQKWKMPETHEFEYVRQKFAPYGSLLMLVLWKLGGMPDMDVLEGSRKKVKNE